MRIGVLTFHRSYNYGAFIQCYSLVSRIKKDFPDCEVEAIDYNTERSADSYRIILASKKGKEKEKLAEMYACFDSAREKYLPVSPEYIETNDKDELFSRIKGRYDVIVVGSDAVWNWVSQPFPNAYMLSGCDCPVKMSYAASAHGQPYKDFSECVSAEIYGSISDFKYIGVREYDTEQMLRASGVQNEIHLNCDPSVLLDINNMPGNISDVKAKFEKHGVDLSKPIIGLMAASPYGHMIKKYFGDNVQIVSVYKENKYSDFFINDLSPFEWVRAFSLFNVTVTHFFHGTMLSLVNGTPVIAVEKKTPYSSNYTTKIHNVLYNMELEMFYYLIDRGSLSIFNKMLYKLEIKNNKELWYCICNRIEELIKNPPKERIYKALDKEATKYQTFKTALENVLHNQNSR